MSRPPPAAPPFGLERPDEPLDESAHLALRHRADKSVHRLALVEGDDRRNGLDAELAGICGWSSMFILTSVTLPPESATAFSSAGPSCLQGPHHGAQKSTSTG